jgi:hypothetical protein
MVATLMSDPKDVLCECGHKRGWHSDEPVTWDDGGTGYPCEHPGCDCADFTPEEEIYP